MDCSLKKYFSLTYWQAWYWIVLTALSSRYIFKNWEDITNFTFFNDFNGKNLLFVVWLAWLVLPLIGSFKVLGTEVNFRNKETKDIDELENKYIKVIESNTTNSNKEDSNNV